MASIFDDIEIETLLDSIGADIIEAAQRELRLTRTIRGKIRNRYNTGTLSEQLTYSVKETPKTFTFKFYASGKGTENYWRVIHDGRRKGATPPPIAPIEKWTEERKIRPRNKNGGFMNMEPKRKGVTKEQKIKSWRHYVAGKISKKIGREGIEAVPFFKEAFDSVWEKRKSEFAPIIDKIIRRTLDKKFKK
jgi:hypothetical protein